MTTPTIVQTAFHNGASFIAAQLAAPATVGNTLLAIHYARDLPEPKSPATGFTLIDDAVHTLDFWRSITMSYHVVEASEAPYTVGGDGVTYNGGGGGHSYAIVEIAGTYSGIHASQDEVNSATDNCGGTVTPTFGVPSLIVGGSAGTGATGTTPFTDVVEVIDELPAGFSPYAWLGYISAPSPSGSYTVGATKGGAGYCGVTAVFVGTPDAPVANFSSALSEVGTASEFTDLSSNTPTSWAWDFGDGGTSTSQNPSHVYASIGTYTVTLTATNSNGSDSVSHDVTILPVGTPEPAAPAGVLLEIYAASPGSARWDVAKWDVDEWSGAGWQDVTPYGVHVNITWGSPRGDQGILSVPDAASWTVDYFDPDRILDPANESGPYFGDLKPYLPIRVSHMETVIRQGFVTGISHNFAKSQRNGYMRGADNITILANAMVPSDTTLSDTLYARAVDAISAAGLTVSVAGPIGTDPPVSPWVTGVREWSVWQWIKDAAQETLHIPIIDRLGTVTFRPWASPLARARTINSPELLDMQDVADYSGQYSVVQAVDDMDVVTERRLTPSPAYGARTFARTEPTLDPDAWADAVLADRALPGLLWVPGDVYPLTAVAVNLYGLLEAVELVSMSLPEQDPPVFASGIVVGGEIDIIGRAQDSQGVWRFNFQTAQTATEPLIETGGDPTDYLLRTGGGEYLYPTGSA